jgi:MSHA biogenesis protein MshG
VPYFAYLGRDPSGDLVEGVMEKASSSAVADELFGIGVTPTEIEPTDGPDPTGAGSGGLWRFRRKVTHIDVLLFSRQMNTLMRAGVPIMQALSSLQQSTTSETFAAVIQDIRVGLEAGRELSATLRGHPEAFSQFYVNMVQVGETTGRLEEIFLQLFSQLEFEEYMRRQVKSALFYPFMVLGAMSIAIVIINIWVIPVFAKVFKGFGAKLPPITLGLIAFSDFMLEYWPHMLVGLVAVVFIVRNILASPAGRFRWDKAKLRIPIAGNIVLKATLARFAQSFSLAAKSGVPVVQALSSVAATVDNDFIASRIIQMRENVERGESVHRAATSTGVFTPIVLQMISVGEESGALDDMLHEVAIMYQQEVEYGLKNLSKQIEPILIVFLGVMVLLLALGVFLPMWDLGQAALHR